MAAAKEWPCTRTRRPARATVCRRVLLPGVGSNARAHSMRSDARLRGVRAQRYFVHYAQPPSLSARGRRRSAAVRPSSAAAIRARRLRAWMLIRHPRAAQRLGRRRRGCQHQRRPAQSARCTDRSILAHVEPIAHAELAPSRGEIHAAFATAGGQPRSAEDSSPRPDLRAPRAIARLAVSPLAFTPWLHETATDLCDVSRNYKMEM